MARIRSIKPDFFRHELLQDLQATHPNECPMLVFAGLWGHCDKQGVFPWAPKHLKLDILPFMAFDMELSLEILRGANLVEVFERDGKRYGYIPTFREHQVITGKEGMMGARYPSPVDKTGANVDKSGDKTGKSHRGQDRDLIVTGRKGRELGRELGREGNRPLAEKPVDKSLSVKSVSDWATELGISRGVGEREGEFQARVSAAVLKAKAA